jgi:hypothetical protein
MVDNTKVPMPSIPSWSNSRWNDFEKCKYRTFLLHVERVPEPQRKLAAGKTEHANDRGSRVHDDCEKFVKGEITNPPAEAMKHFGAEIMAMRNLYSHGIVSLEGEWGMNRNWEPWNWIGQWVEVFPHTPAEEQLMVVKTLPERAKAGEVYQLKDQFFTWVPAWLRLKLDALVFISPEVAVAIDYKTGRKVYNEIKHGEQLQLYQLVTFLRYPQLKKVYTELWYLDVDDITQQQFTRDQGLRFQKLWDKRGNAITTCDTFTPTPSVHACKWCMYGQREGGSGHCKVGVY